MAQLGAVHRVGAQEMYICGAQSRGSLPFAPKPLEESEGFQALNEGPSGLGVDSGDGSAGTA